MKSMKQIWIILGEKFFLVFYEVQTMCNEHTDVSMEESVHEM